MVDERFIMHRYKATRLATLLGTVLMFAFFTYEAVAHSVIRWDLLVVIGVMAVAKVAAVYYYRKTN